MDTSKTTHQHTKTRSERKSLLLNALHRHKNVIIICMLISAGLGAIFLYTRPPLYRAEALLRFKGAEPEKLDSHIKSEEEFIRSNAFLNQITTSLSLERDAFFNPQTTGSEQKSRFKSFNLSEQDQNQEKTSDQNITSITHILFRSLDPNHKTDTNILSLNIFHNNPKKAANLVNAIAALYMDKHNGQEPPISSTTNKTQEQTLKDNVAHAEAELTSFIETENKKNDYSNNETDDLDNRLTLLEIKKTEIMTALGFDTHGDHIPALSDSETIRKLQNDIADLEKDYNKIIKRYGEKHPQRIALQNSIKEKSAKLSRETDYIIQPLIASLKTVNSQISSLETMRNQLQDNTPSAEGNQETKKSLEQTLASAKNALELYLHNTGTATTNQITVEILSRAAIPNEKDKSNDYSFFFAFLAFGLCGGVILALLIENKAKTKLRSAAEIEAEFMMPCAAMIPDVQDLNPTTACDFILNNPSAPATEALRSLRMSIKQKSTDKHRGAHVIAMMSCLPAEGKTLLSCWLARLSAKSGEKILLIDADLRRPRVHTLLGMENSAGLVEYLSGKNSITDLIQKDKSTGLDLLLGHGAPNSATDLLCSDKLPALLETLRKDYDLIIIDTPPSLSVADSKAISVLCDQILYIVTWNKTSKKIVHSGISQVDPAHRKKISFILNKINVAHHAKMGLGDTFCYYGEYKPLESAA